MPPDAVALVVAGVMWLVSTVTPSLNVPLAYHGLIAAVLFVVAAAFVATARIALARAGTTFSPTEPDRSRRLVTSGVYRFTRNPMYLGTLVALLALATLLSNPFSLLLSAAFVPYMNRFQIAPRRARPWRPVRSVLRGVRS